MRGGELEMKPKQKEEETVCKTLRTTHNWLVEDIFMYSGGM